MGLEDQLTGWTGPSSDSEQEKQERTERMVREAIANHEPFENCSLVVYAKGSYANNTNVRADSDVDVAVECTECVYWKEQSEGVHPASSRYTGPWTPTKLRSELATALRAKFSDQVDTSGSTAIQVNASSARVNADVVPCFPFKYYFSSGGERDGTKVFTTSGTYFENYPAQQLANGRAKNSRTGNRFKKLVRIMKRIENAMVETGSHHAVPSYFVECIAYNVPDHVINQATWTDRVKGALYFIWDELEGAEPADLTRRWLEVNEAKYLFHSSQKWSRADGRDFAKAAWNYLELG